MKASTLMFELRNIINKHGDLPLYIDNIKGDFTHFNIDIINNQKSIILTNEKSEYLTNQKEK